MSINIGQIGLPSRNGGGEALESLDQQRALLDQLLDSPLDKDNSRGFRLLRETLLVQQQENSGSDELMEQVYEASVDHSTRHLLQLENNSWCGAFTDHQYSPDRHQHLSELIKALSTLVLSIYPSTNHKSFLSNWIPGRRRGEMTRLFILHLISNLVTSSSPSSSSELMRFISTLPPSLLETQQIRFTLNILRSIHTFPDPPTLTKLISQQSKPQDRIFLNPALRHFRVIVAIRILKSAYVIAPLEHVIRPWFIANLLPNKEESIITIIKNILEKEKVEIDGERGLAIMKKRSTGQ